MTHFAQPTFSTDVGDDIFCLDLLNVVGDQVGISVAVNLPVSTDQVVGAAFTAEVSGTLDATDVASTTLHRALGLSDSATEGIRSATFDALGNRYVVCDWLFTPTEALKLAVPRDYDVRIYVSRLMPDGVTRLQVDRVVQFGKISVIPLI